ncbi:MAG: hypothetical protein K5663_01790 [Clostridiales bacterium]|nr:hypothetical protein [Clostridiales bacterium]
MKRLLCALVCLCMLAAFAHGEPNAQEQYKTFALETVQMTVDCAVENQVTYNGPNWDFTKLDPAELRGGAIITLSAQQAEALDAFASEKACALAEVALFVNSQFSKDYAAASYALTQQGGNSGVESENGVVVWLMYDFHICMCYLHADGSWESAMFMSDKTVLQDFSEEYILGRIETLQFPGELMIEMFK